MKNEDFVLAAGATTVFVLGVVFPVLQGVIIAGGVGVWILAVIFVLAGGPGRENVERPSTPETPTLQQADTPYRTLSTEEYARRSGCRPDRARKEVLRVERERLQSEKSYVPANTHRPAS